MIFVCTRQGDVVRVEQQGWSAKTVLAGVGAACVAADGERVLVGTDGQGVFASPDQGETWERTELPESHVYSVAFSAADGAGYAGTEPSHLFVARDGRGWSELEALQDIPSRDPAFEPPGHPSRDPVIPPRYLVIRSPAPSS